jgi:thiol:disulfide interchange protein DsbC
MTKSAPQSIERSTPRGRVASAVCVLAFTCSVALAADDGGSALQAVLQARIPQIQIDSVRAAPFMGLYEVVTPNEILYSDAKGDLLFVGKVVDTQNREDLTAKRWQETQRIDFNSLPLEKAIKFVKGNGSRKIAVFEDPHCPFCERFEQVLDGTKDVTVYLFLFPIKELHPSAEAVARNIWCSDDRAAAWTNWMLKRVTPAAATCATDPVAEVVVLGEKLKVTGTPTTFFLDGSRIPGALNAEQLELALAERIVAH